MHSSQDQNKGPNTNPSQGSMHSTGTAHNLARGRFSLSRSFSNIHRRADLAQDEHEAEQDEESDVGLKLDVAIAHSQVCSTSVVPNALCTCLFAGYKHCKSMYVWDHSHVRRYCSYRVKIFELQHPCLLPV